MEFLGLKYTHNVLISSDTTESVTDYRDLGVVVTGNGVQRWRARIEFEPTVPALGNAAAAALAAHQLAHGHLASFDLPMPQDVDVATGARTATGDAGAEVVTLTGLPIPTGAFVSFAGDHKVYMTTDDQGGIAPPLRMPLAAAAVNIAPMLRCRYARAGEMGFSTDRRGVLRLVRTFVEAL